MHWNSVRFYEMGVRKKEWIKRKKVKIENKKEKQYNKLNRNKLFRYFYIFQWGIERLRPPPPPQE